MLQIEKDMIHDFYHNTREDIKELESKVRNYDTKMEDAEYKHNVGVITYQQKVQHLEYEHQETLNRVAQDAKTDQRSELNTHQGNETEKRK